MNVFEFKGPNYSTLKAVFIQRGEVFWGLKTWWKLCHAWPRDTFIMLLTRYLEINTEAVCRQDTWTSGHHGTFEISRSSPYVQNNLILILIAST
jgi:hypothetical protein